MRHRLPPLDQRARGRASSTLSGMSPDDLLRSDPAASAPRHRSRTSRRRGGAHRRLCVRPATVRRAVRRRRVPSRDASAVHLRWGARADPRTSMLARPSASARRSAREISDDTFVVTSTIAVRSPLVCNERSTPIGRVGGILDGVHALRWPRDDPLQLGARRLAAQLGRAAAEPFHDQAGARRGPLRLGHAHRAPVSTRPRHPRRSVPRPRLTRLGFLADALMQQEEAAARVEALDLDPCRSSPVAAAASPRQAHAGFVLAGRRVRGVRRLMVGVVEKKLTPRCADAQHHHHSTDGADRAPHPWPLRHGDPALGLDVRRRQVVRCDVADDALWRRLRRGPLEASTSRCSYHGGHRQGRHDRRGSRRLARDPRGQPHRRRPIRAGDPRHDHSRPGPHHVRRLGHRRFQRQPPAAGLEDRPHRPGPLPRSRTLAPDHGELGRAGPHDTPMWTTLRHGRARADARDRPSGIGPARPPTWRPRLLLCSPEARSSTATINVNSSSGCG